MLRLLGTLEPQQAPPPEDRTPAVTAEVLRHCLSYWVRGEGETSVHVLRARSWVTSKLEGITHRERDSIGEDLRAVLTLGPGPTMEAIGDVVRLTGGNIMPTPWTAVRISRDFFLLISGFPVSDKAVLQSHVSFGPVGRTISGLSEGELKQMGLRIISVDSYAGPSARARTALDYLKETALGAGQGTGSIPETWQAYTGEVGGAAGFTFGRYPRKIDGKSSFQLWEAPLGEGISDHYLRTIEGNSTRIVKLRNAEWRRTALAIDAASGSPRSLAVKLEGELRTIVVDFPLPASEYRLLNALAPRWIGFQNGRPRYSLTMEQFEALPAILDRCWVRIRPQ